MFRKLLSFIVIVCIGIPMVAISVANRQPVELKLNPFSASDGALTLNQPLFLYLFGALIAGVIVGGMATWLSQSKWRRTARVRTQEAYKWKNESERLIKERDAQLEAQRSSVPQLAKAS